VLTVVVIARVNVFLDVTSQRPDWQNLMARYRSSGFSSLRAYANYIYFTGAPFKLLVASTIGALCGFIGACLTTVIRSTSIARTAPQNGR